MEARELRIGNYVYFGIINEPIKITGGIDICNPTIVMAKPIPLTKEWLLKFGFEMIEDKTEEVWYWAYKDFVLEPTFFCFGYASPIVFDLIRVNEDKPLIHVHQLQNLYFALTGEELEITKTK
jgi:hypothetical protein